MRGGSSLSTKKGGRFVTLYTLALQLKRPFGALLERTAEAVPSLFKMKLDDLEKTMEPIFAMCESQLLTSYF